MNRYPQKVALDKPRRNSQLYGLLTRAAEHETLEEAVLARLPAALAGRCRFVSYHDGDLTLSVTSSVQATQVRFHQKSILTGLREDERFRFAWRLQVKVIPNARRQRPPRPKMKLSHENARLLEEEAGHTEDENLKQILQRLARHGT